MSEFTSEQYAWMKLHEMTPDEVRSALRAFGLVSALIGSKHAEQPTQEEERAAAPRGDKP
jgi:hypothetical protein